MITVLRNGTYRALFFAQVIALVGTGLLTVALGLLAFEIAGDAAGSVLGTALTIKMVAYVGVAPLVAALVDRLPKKAVLVGAMDAKVLDAIISQIPVGRLGKGEEIADMVSWLVGERAGYVTGCTLSLNGGQYLVG